MIWIWIALVVVGWIGCGALTYGMTLAYFQSETPLEDAADMLPIDQLLSALFSLLGPAAMFVTFFATGRAKHGLMYRVPK